MTKRPRKRKHENVIDMFEYPVQNPSSSWWESHRKRRDFRTEQDIEQGTGLDLTMNVNYYLEHGKLPDNQFIANLKKHRNTKIQ